jgi:hypothetical protein
MQAELASLEYMLSELDESLQTGGFRNWEIPRSWNRLSTERDQKLKHI